MLFLMDLKAINIRQHIIYNTDIIYLVIGKLHIEFKWRYKNKQKNTYDLKGNQIHMS